MSIAIIYLIFKMKFNFYEKKKHGINHAVVGEDGFEPSKRIATDLQSAPFGHSGTPPIMELAIGIEPTTC